MVRSSLRQVTVAALLAMSGATAFAAEKDQGPTDVELPGIFAPIIVQNRLESYVYLSIALKPASRDKVLLIREKVPFIIDAFLREVNKTAITKADDPRTVDTTALKARLLTKVDQVLPRGSVSDLKFQQVALSALQPQS